LIVATFDIARKDIGLGLVTQEDARQRASAKGFVWFKNSYEERI